MQSRNTEYCFFVPLYSMIRVKAATVEEAKEKVVGEVDMSGLIPLGETESFCIMTDGDVELFEVNGQEQENLAIGKPTYENLHRKLGEITLQLNALAGDTAGPSGAAWQDIAKNLAKDMRGYARMLEQLYQGTVQRPIVFPALEE